MVEVKKFTTSVYCQYYEQFFLFIIMDQNVTFEIIYVIGKQSDG